MKHLACIMDGNRRWARGRGMLPWYGHRKGVDTVETVFDFCVEKNIEHLSLYTFSLENLSRPAHETQPMFQMLLDEADSIVRSCCERNARIRFIGDETQYSADMKQLRDTLETGTAASTGLRVYLLFCYGARQEILNGVKEIVRKVQAGQLREEEISQELLESHLWMAGIPAPDLIVRTGGVQRLSNFLLYQAAYSEIYFLDRLWPDLRREDLQAAFDYVSSCKRSFGI